MAILMEASLRWASESSRLDLALSILASVWGAPPAARVCQHHSLSLVPRKKHKKYWCERGSSPKLRKDQGSAVERDLSQAATPPLFRKWHCQSHPACRCW